MDVSLHFQGRVTTTNAHEQDLFFLQRNRRSEGLGHK